MNNQELTPEQLPEWLEATPEQLYRSARVTPLNSLKHYSEEELAGKQLDYCEDKTK